MLTFLDTTKKRFSEESLQKLLITLQKYKRFRLFGRFEKIVTR